MEGFKGFLVGIFIALFISVFYFILQDKSNRSDDSAYGPTNENRSEKDDDGEE